MPSSVTSSAAAASCAILSSLLLDSAAAGPSLRTSSPAAFAPSMPLAAGHALRAAAPLRPAAVSKLSMSGGGGWTPGGGGGIDIIGGNAPKRGGKGARNSEGFQDSGLGFEIPVGAKVTSKELETKTPGDPEVILAELAFSNPMEMPKIIERNLPYLDDGFFTYIDNKIKSTPDKEESETLTLLKEAVVDLKTQIQAAISSAKKQAEAEQALLDAKEEGKDLDAGAVASDILGTFDESDLAVASYDTLMDEVRRDPATLESAVEASYDRFDMRFLERLNERIDAAEGEERESLSALNGAIQQQMSARIQKASAQLQDILKAGNPDQMMEQLAVVNAKGGLDDALILLIEANIEMAKKANAGPAVQVMTALRNKAIEYKDESMPKEMKLVRQLLRTDDKEARRQLLLDAFTPKDKMYTDEGVEMENQNVDGRRFVEALRNLIQNFGNIDPKFLSKVDEIAKESEIAARDIFGLEEKDVSTMQEEAFHDRTVSVWDLEQLEEAYVENGEKAPWQFPSRAGWDEEGNMVIGGDSFKKGQDGEGSNVIW